MAHQPAHWPHHDQDDDPPAGVTIRPLRQLPNLPASAPMPPEGAPGTSWERGGSFGAPGGSAMAAYQRARAGEWTRFVRTLPWRLAAVIGAGGLGRLAPAVSNLRGDRRVAPRRPRGAAHRPPSPQAGPGRLDRAARRLDSRQPRQR